MVPPPVLPKAEVLERSRLERLPQRIAAFEAFLARFSWETGLDTSGIGRISPPWTYQLLAGLSGTMLLGELAWGIRSATGN